MTNLAKEGSHLYCRSMNSHSALREQSSPKSAPSISDASSLALCEEERRTSTIPGRIAHMPTPLSFSSAPTVRARKFIPALTIEYNPQA